MAGVETCSNQGHLEGSSVTPGGVQLSSKIKKNSAKIPDNPNLEIFILAEEHGWYHDDACSTARPLTASHEPPRLVTWYRLQVGRVCCVCDANNVIVMGCVLCLAKSAVKPYILSALIMSSTPADAPEHCPGTTSADAGKASACEGCPNQQICATSSKAPDPDIELIRKRMSSIKKKVLCCLSALVTWNFAHSPKKVPS